MPALLALAVLTTQTPTQPPFQTENPKLRALAAVNEAARGDYMKLLRSEVKALREVKAMMDADELKTANDFYAAGGLVFNVPSYEGRLLVHEFTMTALFLGSKEALQRVKLSWDRLQYDSGRPTRFGAMFGRPDKEGKRPVLFPDPEGPPPILVQIFDGTAPAPGENNAELQTLMDAAQKDRQNVKTPADWDRMSANDGPRRARVLAILKEGKATTGADLYNAALVLQHGEGYRDFMLAHELCLAAVARGYKDADWLVSRTYDRMLERGGHAQRFATQQRGGAGGTEFFIMAVDLPGPSDTMRKLFRSPSREAAKKGYDAWLKSIDG